MKITVTRHIVKITAILFLAVVVFPFSACKKKNLKAVEVAIEDVDRHYYPVIQGEILPVNYDIENISEDPLVIQEIQTSCGCLIPYDDLPIIILPNKKAYDAASFIYFQF